ncbi:uncharacterized protein [Acropora muricata]
MDKCSDRQRLVSQPVFKEFLESHAPKLYKIILDSILSEHHGEKRANLQEKRATALIWQLLYYRMSGSCIHVTALVFRIEAANRTGMTNPACTSKQCLWNKPADKTVIKPAKIIDMDWKAAKLNKGTSEACLGLTRVEAITGWNSTSLLFPFAHCLGFDVQHLLSEMEFCSSEFLVMFSSFQIIAIT